MSVGWCINYARSGDDIAALEGSGGVHVSCRLCRIGRARDAQCTYCKMRAPLQTWSSIFILFLHLHNSSRKRLHGSSP